MNSSRFAPLPLILAGATLALAACAAGGVRPSSTATASVPCAASVGTPGQPPEAAPTVLPSPPNNAIRIDRSYTLTGDCADEARAFEMEHILFSDGRVMAIGAGGTLSLVTRRPAPVEPSAFLPEEAPRLDGAPLIYAARVGALNVRPPVPSLYVGVWRTGRRSIVATFRLSADGRTTTPRPLLESELPIVGLGYFPSPDSPSGQLGVVQQISANRSLLLNYQWHHPGL